MGLMMRSIIQKIFFIDDKFEAKFGEVPKDMIDHLMSIVGHLSLFCRHESDGIEHAIYRAKDRKRPYSLQKTMLSS
ncbi:hypothetical protein ACS0TY_035963 [Phlomoides rotata]